MRCKTGLLYAFHLLLTGCFFQVSGYVVQSYIWDEKYSLTEYQKLGLPQITDTLYRLCGAYQTNYAFANLAFLGWLVIVFVTLDCWRRDKTGLRMLIRVAVATWLVFLAYAVAIAAVIFTVRAPYHLLLAEMEAHNVFARTVDWIATISGYGILFLLVFLIGRAVRRKVIGQK